MKYIIKCFLGWLLSIKYNRNKNQLYFIVWGHIGEAVYALSLLPELIRIKNKKINIITFNPYSQIAELYSDYCEKIIVLSRRKVEFIKEYSQSNVLQHYNYIGGGWEWEENELLYLDVPDIYVPGLNYKIKDLGIPYTTKHSQITNPVNQSEEGFIELIDKLNVEKEHSVLLIPYAQSAKELEMFFWEELAKCLHDYGYKVYTNVKDDSENPIEGTIPAKIPLRYVIPFIKYAGSAISIRCGLTDLIAVSDCEMEVLYKVEDELDNVLASIWSFKLGKENILYENKWIFKEEKNYKDFISYIKEKYKN